MSLLDQPLALGDAMPDLTLPAVTRHMLALYCGASGDHNPLHTDIDFARRAGLPDVIAHGMLVMAWLGRALTQWVPQNRLRSFEVRFVAQTQIGDVVRCSGQVTEIIRGATGVVARVALQASRQTGELLLTGAAEIAEP